jgi:hypothetical protein
MRLHRIVTLSLLAAAVASSGCNRSSSNSRSAGSSKTASFDHTVATQWMSLLYDIIKSTPLPPPVASRAIGYCGVTLYESVVPGMPAYQSLAGQLNDFDGVPQPTGQVDYRLVANGALADVIRGGVIPGIKPADVTLCDNLEQSVLAAIQADVNATIVTRSTDLGDAVAAAILAWAATDGLSIFNNCDVDPPVGAGLWVSLTATPPVQACWDQLRPFVLLPASECPPAVYPAFDETPASPFWNEADEVFDTGVAGANLTPDQREIAFFWSDGGGTGTPPGHWVSIVEQILTTDDASLEVAAEAYAKVGLAVADAFISCWQAKFQYWLERPITYIQRVIDPGWTPLLSTPNFPEFSSGHSVQSGAAARVLTDVFGPRAFTDDTHNLHANAGVLVNAPNPRNFADFDAAAQEAADSRLYGGIHFRSAIDNGVAQGTCVGDQVLLEVNFLK